MMKIEPLRYPYSWGERRPHLGDQVFFVPDHYAHYEDHSLPPWEMLFGKDAPLRLEYCSGNGDWIAQRALDDPNSNWIALEIKFDRVQKIWKRIKRYGLSNLFLFCGEALLTTRHYLNDAVLDEIFINFPDPWPKRRHAKNRLIDEPFSVELQRVLKSGAQVTLATDSLAFCKESIGVLNKAPLLTPVFPTPNYITEWSEYGDSYFDTLWRSQGREIYYVSYRKI